MCHRRVDVSYLTVFLGGSILRRQSDVSLSHLDQLLFNNGFFLQQPHKSDPWSDFCLSAMLFTIPSPTVLAMPLNLVGYLDNILGGKWDGLRCGCDVLQCV